jgi:hypothetical protein
MGLINADRLNTNFSRLYNEVNGLLDEANIENPCKILVSDRNYSGSQIISGYHQHSNYIQLNACNELRFADTDSSNYVGFEAPGTISANKIWVLPAADGSANAALITDGSGNLSFTSFPLTEVYWHLYGATTHIYRNEGTVAIGTDTPDSNYGLHVASDSGILYEPLTVTLTSGWIKLRTNFGVTADAVKLGFQWSTNAATNVNLWKQYVTHNNGAEYHDLIFYNDQKSTETLRLTGSGAATTAGVTAVLTGSLKSTGNLMVISTAKTPIANNDAGEIGTVCWDSSYIYVCIATNTWKRAAISTWP